MVRMAPIVVSHVLADIVGSIVNGGCGQAAVVVARNLQSKKEHNQSETST